MAGEPTDAMGQWTIKSVATSVREKATIAARQGGVTVVRWLERRVNEWLADGDRFDPRGSPAPWMTCASLRTRLPETSDGMPKGLHAIAARE